jgi:hypothetical protein
MALSLVSPRCMLPSSEVSLIAYLDALHTDGSDYACRPRGGTEERFKGTTRFSGEHCQDVLPPLLFPKGCRSRLR